MPRQRMSVLSLMRAVAACGMMLAAMTSEASVQTLVGVTGVGLAIWLVELGTGRIPESEDDALRGRGVVALALGALLIAEAAGFAISVSQSDHNLSLFYGLAVILQLAALITTSRCGPDDMSLVAWGSCHAAIALSAILILLTAAALAIGGNESQIPFAIMLILGLFTTLSVIFVACSFLLLMAALALGLLMEPERRRRAWTSLILLQAAILLVFLRWPWAER